MNNNKNILSFIFSCLLVITFKTNVFAANYEYTVASGDSLWKISQNFKVTVDAIKSFNNLTTDNIYIGQKLIIPSNQQNTVSYNNTAVSYNVIPGDNLWSIAQKFNTTISTIKYLNNLRSDIIIPGQILTVTSPSNIFPNTPGVLTTHIEFINYLVKSGDNIWSIGQNFKLPYQEILNANNLTSSSSLKIGQTLKIPVHIVPEKQTPGPQFGELLDWYKEAQYVFYTGSVAKVTDYYTGKVFYIKRTIGANHADCETLTIKDTNIMKEIFGGQWKWVNRPVIIEVGGRKLAASMAGMPHAGLDAYPALTNINNRSGNYGFGPNFDYIKGNGMDGHFDVHFLNSTRHNSGTIDADHQAKLLIAAGK